LLSPDAPITVFIANHCTEHYSTYAASDWSSLDHQRYGRAARGAATHQQAAR
jgi:hypothetical protein